MLMLCCSEVLFTDPYDQSSDPIKERAKDIVDELFAEYSTTEINHFLESLKSEIRKRAEKEIEESKIQKSRGKEILKLMNNQ